MMALKVSLLPTDVISEKIFNQTENDVNLSSFPQAVLRLRFADSCNNSGKRSTPRLMRSMAMNF